MKPETRALLNHLEANLVNQIEHAPPDRHPGDHWVLLIGLDTLRRALDTEDNEPQPIEPGGPVFGVRQIDKGYNP